jgi:transcriptional regulator with XRE-family HTH domain
MMMPAASGRRAITRRRKIAAKSGVDSGEMTMPRTPPSPVDVHVGERVRMWRTERKISRITLGEAIGLTHQQIQKYEKGINRIGASGLQQICNVLKIPVSLLFEGAPGSLRSEGGMPQYIIDFMASEEGARFVAAFSRITNSNAARHRAAGRQDRRTGGADR